MDNVKRLLNALDNPQDSFSYIHVAGTNGKGSVCAYIEQCLRLCGKKTGLFTSPHLVKANERMRIGGTDISDEDFVRLFEQINTLAKEEEKHGCQQPTFFEYIYLMAMVWFREQKVDFAVVEAGMGGRMDFTNAVSHPRLTVLTSISLDHVPILGNTVAEIAAEKAGIIKHGSPLVCTNLCEDAREPVMSAVIEQEVTCDSLSDVEIHILSDDERTMTFSMRRGQEFDYTFHLHTPAVYQAQNAALAVLAMKELWKDIDKRADFYELVHEGLSRTYWAGRMEEITKDFFIDGAHNEDGVEAFAKTIETGFSHRDLYLIFAVAGDKDYEHMIARLCRIKNLRAVVVTEIENGRRFDGDKAAAIFEKNWHGPVIRAYTISEAISKGFDLRRDTGVLCCVGSLYLAGSIKEITGGISDDQL